MTHTIEVENIARLIAEKLNENNTQLKIDLKLIKAIALAHDIGHTPFGHIGERTINNILSKKDKLGGLIKITNNKIKFKHNANSMRILFLNNIEDWRILDGVMFHTQLFYENDKNIYFDNPYDFLTNSLGGIKNELYRYHKIFNFHSDNNILHSLTIEGQIVAMANEISQRIADISDGIKSRHLEKIKKILQLENEINTRKELESNIFNYLIKEVVSESLKKIKDTSPEKVKIKGIEHHIYYKEVILFSKPAQNINTNLKNIVKAIMTNSEEVRESDSRSKYIIRQLFKAYFNDLSLLPDVFIKDFFNNIINTKEFKNSMEKFKIFEKINARHWLINSKKMPKGVEAINFEIVNDFISLIKDNCSDYELSKIYDKFIFEIGYYIASLSNSDVFNAYNKIYGH